MTTEVPMQTACALHIHESLPKRPDWESALAALLRQRHGVAFIHTPYTGKGATQIRITFREAIPSSHVPAKVDLMVAAATNLIRAMREFEEDTALADFQKAEKQYREGETVMKRALATLQGAKTLVEAIEAGKALATAAQSLAALRIALNFPGFLP
jgi:hypothetical protein